jgi:hypothetical protein
LSASSLSYINQYIKLIDNLIVEHRFGEVNGAWIWFMSCSYVYAAKPVIHVHVPFRNKGFAANATLFSNF